MSNKIRVLVMRVSMMPWRRRGDGDGVNVLLLKSTSSQRHGRRIIANNTRTETQCCYKSLFSSSAHLERVLFM